MMLGLDVLNPRPARQCDQPTTRSTMTSRHPYSSLIALLAALFICAVSASTALAQQPAATPPQPSQNTEDAASTQDAATFGVTVAVTRSEEAIPGAPVFLRAARPKGPFEPTDPKPAREWTGVTDKDGVATFDGIPKDLAKQGLRLHAVTTVDGTTYKSPASTPTPDLRLNIPVYERGAEASALRIPSVRMIVEPWEGYLVFTQMWTLTVEGDKALDTSMLSGARYAEGLPFTFPLKAQGINVRGPGDTKTVGGTESTTLYWQGVIRPGEPINLQIRFSISVRDSDFAYQQLLDYQLGQLEIIIPLETQYKEKLPRLNGLGFRAPNFKADNIKSGFNIPGLRPDKEFIWAKRTDIPAGDAILFQLKNLPYKRPVGPWVALGIGLFGALVVFFFASRATRRDRTDVHELIEQLRHERDELIAELRALEEDYDEGYVTDREYDAESLALRTRIALILKKLDELEQTLNQGPRDATAATS